VSGKKVGTSHYWTELGGYEVKVMAKDVYDVESEWSEPATIEIIVNSPPVKPTIDGARRIQAQKEYTYNISASDPNGHDLYLFVYWGDGDIINWEGPFKSGETATFKNSWPEPGNYVIQVKARDLIGHKSETATLSITVTRNRATANDYLLAMLDRFFDIFPALLRLLDVVGQ
jgi:hypothetical protein